MPRELPIACTLNAIDFAARERLIADLGRDALIDARQEGTRAALRFAPRAGIRERVDRFVIDESRCCAFLAMEVVDAADEVVLTIDAPADAEVVVADMVAAFRPANREVA
jgi:hypothetical protein